jgi:hypothetical protein
MRSRLRIAAGRWILAMSWAYLTYLLLWLLTYIFTGQRLWLLELLDGAIILFFVPLPFIAVAAARARRPRLLIATGLAALMPFWLW